VVHRDPLPAFTTPLVGRGAELVALRDLLTSGAFRLLTLTEPPGVGKTRLAVEAARLVASRFPRVVFVDLGVVRDPGLVVASVAQATGIGERVDQPTLAWVIHRLRRRRWLVVLDNFEHLQQAAPDVGALVSGCPHLVVMVTSRTPLHLLGEHTFPVQPLPLLCSSRGRVRCARTLPLKARPSGWWRRSVRDSTGFRWRSSWRAAGSGLPRWRPSAHAWPITWTWWGAVPRTGRSDTGH